MPQINEKTWIIIAVVIALIGSLIYKKYSVFVYAYEDDRGYQ